MGWIHRCKIEPDTALAELHGDRPGPPVLPGSFPRREETLPIGPWQTAIVINRYLLRADFRQDLVDERIAWGFTIAERDDRPLFKVDELDIYGEGIAMDAFIETTRWFGVKIRLQGENMLDFTEWRNRTVYEGRRTLSTIDFRENREFLNGRKLTLSISGSF